MDDPKERTPFPEDRLPDEEETDSYRLERGADVDEVNGARVETLDRAGRPDFDQMAGRSSPYAYLWFAIAIVILAGIVFAILPLVTTGYWQ